MKTASRGFSLLELLIVVAIILIIATIAIPSLLRSRQAANESVAVANMRNLNSGQATYSAANGGTYGDIPALVLAGVVDNRFQSGAISGYQYTMTLSSDLRNYTARAVAVSSNSARYDYYTLPDFVIRYSEVASRSPLGLSGKPIK